MKDGYFHRVSARYQNRLWVNNPTSEEADRAIEAGAIGCTTNPAFASKMLRSPLQCGKALQIAGEAAAETGDNHRAVARVQQRLVKDLSEKFMPLYEENPGKAGFVSIQGDPNAEEDFRHILGEAMENIKLNPNIIAKIPVTEAGLEAIRYLLAENVPVIATEIMGVSQAIAACELHRDVAAATGKAPPFFVTHITGIFDQYLEAWALREGIDISGEALAQAGCAIARKQYALLAQRGYPVTMLGGGARDTRHFTEMVGSGVHVTLNWSGMADKLIEDDPPVLDRMTAQMPGQGIMELLDKLPDFRKAYREDGMKIEEFMDFGPVKFFRDMFVKGWDQLLNTVQECRRGG